MDSKWRQCRVCNMVKAQDDFILTEGGDLTWLCISCFLDEVLPLRRAVLGFRDKEEKGRLPLLPAPLPLKKLQGVFGIPLSNKRLEGRLCGRLPPWPVAGSNVYVVIRVIFFFSL